MDPLINEQSLIEQFSNLLTLAITTDNTLLSSWRIFWFLTVHGGWLVFATFGWLLAWHFWKLRRREHWAHKNRHWVLLAIDVPKDNEQTPKAVENIFAHLAGAHNSLTRAEMYWYGMTQDYFSLEIVGIEGSVQFIIRTVDRYRDLVEAAIYGQYPDAEITEIDDYTHGFPHEWPNERYQMYGTEFYLVENEAFPIRTYTEFEHQMKQEFKDPMQALLETMNKLGAGEQLWLQFIIVPINNHWKEEAIELARKLQKGESGHGHGGIFSSIVDEIFKLGHSASDQVSGGSGVVVSEHAAAGSTLSSLSILSGYDRERVEGISRKVKKIGFEVKIRSVYIATKERYMAAHGREALVGAMKQFNTEDLNALRPDTGSVGIHAHYYFTEWRKNWKRRKLMHRYITRDWDQGVPPFVLNIEELATLWHFPTKSMLVPMSHMVQRTDFKHTPPPASLPYMTEFAQPRQKASPPAPQVPDNLPIAE